MALDTGANTIAELDQTEPPGSASAVIADDNFRAIKRVLKNIFPGVGLNGFDIPITATEDQINYLGGDNPVNAPIQDQIDTLRADLEAENYVLHAPLGTRLVLHNKAVPDGWVPIELNDRFNLVITDEAIIQDGGFISFGKNDCTVWTHNHQVDISIPYSSMPRHRHELWAASSGPGVNLVWSGTGQKAPCDGVSEEYGWGGYTTYEGSDTDGEGDTFPETTHNRTYEPRYTYAMIIERQD